MRFRSTLVPAVLLLCTAAPASAAEPTYWQDVRPVLRKHCTVCHNARHLEEPEVSAGLALDTLDAIRRGGKAPVVRGRDGAGSPLVQILRDKDPRRRMPLETDPLPDADVALLTRWIDAGMPEGKPPEDVASVAPRPARPRRRLDVTLPTSATLPKELAHAGKTSPLELTLPLGPLAPVTALVFSPDGKLLAAGRYGRVTVWDLEQARPAQTITNVLGAVNDLRFSPDGKLLAVAGGQPSARGEVRLFSAGDWKLLANLSGHADVVSSVAFRPGGRQLVSASFDRTLRVWDLQTFQAVRTIGAHSDFVHAVDFAPGGDWFATASKDRSVRVFDAETGQSKLTFSGMNEDVLAVAVGPGGKNVVSSGFESALYWWDPATGERVRTQGGHGVAVNELRFSPRGDFLASAGSDETLRVWNASGGAATQTIRVGSIVYAVAVHPGGKVVASGSFDGLVKLWDRQSGRHLLTLLSAAGAGGADEWLAAAPEGFADGSEGVLRDGRWRVAKAEWQGPPPWPALRKPEELRKAFRGEKLSAPAFDLP